MTAELILNRAEELREELIENRRTFHSFAETGFDLPRTTAFVEEKLRSYGLEPVRCGKAGITCVIGDPEKGKCFLLRGDMDALPMTEESGLPFAPAGTIPTPPCCWRLPGCFRNTPTSCPAASS